MLRKILAAGLLTASLVVTVPAARADDLTGVSRFLCSVVSVGRCRPRRLRGRHAGWRHDPAVRHRRPRSQTPLDDAVERENRSTPIETFRRDGGLMVLQGLQNSRAFERIVVGEDRPGLGRHRPGRAGPRRLGRLHALAGVQVADQEKHHEENPRRLPVRDPRRRKPLSPRAVLRTEDARRLPQRRRLPAGRPERPAAVAGRGGLLQLGRPEHGRRPVRRTEEGRTATAACRAAAAAGPVGRAGRGGRRRREGSRSRRSHRCRRRRRRDRGRRRGRDRSGRGRRRRRRPRRRRHSRRRPRASRPNRFRRNRSRGSKRPFALASKARSTSPNTDGGPA